MRFDRSAALAGSPRKAPGDWVVYPQVWAFTSVYPTACRSSAYVPSHPLQ